MQAILARARPGDVCAVMAHAERKDSSSGLARGLRARGADRLRQVIGA